MSEAAHVPSKAQTLQRQTHREPRVNEGSNALTHTLMHTYTYAQAHVSLRAHRHTHTHTHTHPHTPTQVDHAKHRHTGTHTRKVLPRRTSATLSSLKPAKYSPSAAVLSKLPTQARKRHQLPGRGGWGDRRGQGASGTMPVGLLGGRGVESPQKELPLNVQSCSTGP